MKEYEVVVVMYIEAESKEQAHAQVVEWMDEMTTSTDNFPKGFAGAGVTSKEDV